MHVALFNYTNDVTKSTMSSSNSIFSGFLMSEIIGLKANSISVRNRGI